jgi:hypothetical protein
MYALLELKDDAPTNCDAASTHLQAIFGERIGRTGKDGRERRDGWKRTGRERTDEVNPNDEPS